MFLYSVSWCNVFSQTRICERAWDGREEDMSSSVWCNWFLKRFRSLSRAFGCFVINTPQQSSPLENSFMINFWIICAFFFSWRKKGSAFPFDERWLMTDWLMEQMNAETASHPRWSIAETSIVFSAPFLHFALFRTIIITAQRKWLLTSCFKVSDGFEVSASKGLTRGWRLKPAISSPYIVRRADHKVRADGLSGAGLGVSRLARI